MSARESLSARVRRGVALLDKKVPGWHQKINVDELALGSCLDCVLGQVFGDYNHGFNSLELDAGSAFGFDLRWADSDDDYIVLNRLWRFVVRRRRQAVFYVHRDESGVDLAYMVTGPGDVWCWSEKDGWWRSGFRNLGECSEYDRAHFADGLVVVSVEQLPAGAR